MDRRRARGYIVTHRRRRRPEALMPHGFLPLLVH
jgi:hypothetical protein